MNTEVANLIFNYVEKSAHQDYDCRYILRKSDASKHYKASYRNENDCTMNQFNIPVINLRIPHEMFINKGNIDGREFVPVVINYYHELYHALQYTSDNMSDDLVSYISRCYNTNTYRANRSLFSYEIAAERFALQKSRDVLSKYMNAMVVNLIICDYANSIIDDDRNKSVDKRKYFIYNQSRFNDVNDIIKALDKAYEESFVVKKDFEKYENDLVGKVLKDNSSAKNKYDACKNGREQALLTASIVLGHHPELYKTHKFLDKDDFDKEFVIPKPSIFNIVKNPSYSYDARVAEVDMFDTEDDSDISRTDPTDDW